MSRWITVANRLPFSISGQGKISTASGGLVSALSGVKSHGERLWLGCAPDGLTEENWPQVERTLQEQDGAWKYQPVFVPKDLYDSYYNGVCNDVLWPLLHYETELVAFNTAAWANYREVNARIAMEISKIAKEDDLIWIHDFHLFLVPKLLKARRPELRVGFFLHVPFPSSEVFRQIPAREEILSSLLDSDLIGFHDYSYLEHFTSSAIRLLGYESEFLSLRKGAKRTRLGVFPVSIDTAHFEEKAKKPEIKALADEMEKPSFLFLGVDRLDYIKGLDLKLKAFRTMLRRFPQYREKVRLIQVAVPTRTGVPVYTRLAREVARLVGEINGEFSTPNWTPVQYIHASISNDQLIALYQAADALLVTSKRDGMNLVALEYISSQSPERPGVVLLSEFAGAISTLSHAIPVNPWDLEDSARKMQLALEMPKQEKLFRLRTMQDFLQKYTATHWAETFIAELGKQCPNDRPAGPQIVGSDEKSVEMLTERLLQQSPKRITLFLDYDGTLVPIEETPDRAVLTPALRKEVQKLCRYPWLDIVVVSGRDSRFLNNQFADLPIVLGAAHGAKAFDPVTGRWHRRVHRSRASWYPTALKIFGDYAARVPHSQIEKKHFAIAWHYRQSPVEYGEFQARKLAKELELGLANLPVSILRGKKVIEVRAVEADKGVFASSYLEQAPEGTVAIGFGDDRTDEDLFMALRGRGMTFKVGPGSTAADFAIASQSQTMEFLQSLLESLDRRMKTVRPAKAVAKEPIATA